ncbi:hypothetical protein ACP4OV_022531 [Aristida adscensionis]
MEGEEEEGEAWPRGRPRVGEYEVRRVLGKGSFAKVYSGVHQLTGALVALKAIDLRRVDERVREGILQERRILNSISHPNILRLLDTVDTEKVLYLVLEHCNGGDLDAFLRKHGRLPEATAKDLMRQLAEGLKVLRGRKIVHRDLKPQMSLVQENLAATICGSPLYMAPEIWQGEQYDAKSDLWSVGVILFQLVTGRLPFPGSNYNQLRRNILTSDELKFPPEIEADLHPDCIDLCRRLLRRDPKKRISFEEFFNHDFLAITRSSSYSGVSVRPSSIIASTPLCLLLLTCNTLLPYGQRKCEIISESCHDTDLRDMCQTNSSDVINTKSESVDSKNSKVFDSWEWIEREYVLVSANNSMEMLSSVEKSAKDDAGTKTAGYGRSTARRSALNQNKGSICTVIAGQNHGCTPGPVTRESITVEDIRGKQPNYYMRLHVLNQYVAALTELAREKHLKGLELEALSIELVILAIWKEALDACSLFMHAVDDGNFSAKSNNSSLNVEQGLDFTKPASVCSWAESGFMMAYDRAEEISHRLQENNDNTEMPDAMEIIFQTALGYGKSGAAYEVLGQQSRSVALYSKAIILLTFILHEASTLPLNPPFSLSPSNQQRIHRYIADLKSHLCSGRVGGQQQRLLQN